MNIKLVGVGIAELETALKYSGLYVQTDDAGDYAEIKAIPEFLRTNPSIPQCGCDAAKQLQEIKTKMRAKTAELKTQVEEMGYKVMELSVHLGRFELQKLKQEIAEEKYGKYLPKYRPKTPEQLEKRLADIEFWEKMQQLHEAAQSSEVGETK
jgi:hypothetical protein